MRQSSRDAPTTADTPTYCQGHSKFTDAFPTHAFQVQGETIILKHDPDVFPPSAFGLKFAEYIDFGGCRRAIDIGTGTGLLAILAAKKGVPEIHATDVSAHAVRLAEQNARDLNEVRGVMTRQGSFLGNLCGCFDVITANLPQEILPPDYHAELSPLQSQAINGGGVGGNAILLEFLDVAPLYMHPGTRLYVIVNTITDYRATLHKINERYCPTLVWEGATNAKAFVRDHIGFFRRLIEDGLICMTEDAAGNWRARQFIYRLALKV